MSAEASSSHSAADSVAASAGVTAAGAASSSPTSSAAAASAASSSSATPSTSAAGAAAPSKSPKPYKKPRDPRMEHASSATWDAVYEPVEDSYLLMDALYLDLVAPEGPHWLHRIAPPAAAAPVDPSSASGSTAVAAPASSGRPGFARCLEVGPGSGIIISYLSLLLRNRGFFWAVDLNPDACRCTAATMRENRVRGDVLQGELSEPLEARLGGKMDVLVFNPPYVPTPPEELLGTGISRSWAGGERGREVLDLLLPRVQHLLAPRGTLYLVLLACNDPPEVADILRREGGFRAKEVLRRRAGREDLSIVRYWRPTEEELKLEEEQRAQQHNAST